jgi:uncharacterized protein (TIGR02246 family)
MDPVLRLLAESEITRLVTEYAVLNDAGEFDRVAALFTEDGVLTRPSGGAPIRGRDAILEAFRARPPRISRHVIANVLVDVKSLEEASCRSTLLLFSAPPGSLPATALEPVLVGGFDDRLAKRDGKWCFAERRGWLDLRLGS